MLSYSYRPNQQEREISPWFEPVDTLDRQNLVSLSLKNYLDARRNDERGRPTYSQIARFNLTQGFDLNEAREDKVPGEKRKPFNPLELEASLTPYPALDLSASAQWDHYKRHIASSSVSLDLVVDLNRKLSGWANYFCLGPVSRAYRAVDAHVTTRLRRWLCGKHKVSSQGFSHYPDTYLTDTLGLVRLPLLPRTFPCANA